MIDVATDRRSAVETLAVKVPEVTAIFWVIKVLTTGMGEAASDYMLKLSAKHGGMAGTAAFILLSFLAFGVAIWLQLRTRRHQPPTYWLAVSMVAVFGTVAADVVHHGIDLSYITTSSIYAAVVA